MAYYRPGAKPKKLHPADVFVDAEIARASSYSVYFRKGPFETYSERAESLVLAQAIEARMNAAHGEHGRRALIYAVTPEGRHYPLQR
jgi:hypothetical protein